MKHNTQMNIAECPTSFPCSKKYALNMTKSGRANGLNIDGQDLPTLLGLFAAHPVECCCMSLGAVAQSLKLCRDCKNVAQQC